MPRVITYHCPREDCKSEFGIPTYHLYLTYIAWWRFRLHKLMHILRDWYKRGKSNAG
jgi:hypothetical protein